MTSNESDNSEGFALLSDMLEQRDGYIEQTEVESYCAYAASLSREPKKTPEDIAWLADFNQQIGRAVCASIEIAEKVARRAAPNDSSTSPSVKARVLQFQSQPLPTTPTVGASASKSDIFEEAHQEHHEYEIQRLRPQVKPVMTIKMNELVIKPEIFDGSRKEARRWLEDYEAAAAANSWREEIMVKYFSAFLSKAARDWYTTLVAPMIDSKTGWEILKQRFIRYYIGPDMIDSLKDDLNKMRQRNDESITEFIPRVMRIMRVVNPYQSEEDRVKEMKRKLLFSTQDRLIGIDITTITKLNDICLAIEERHQAIAKSRDKKFDVSKQQTDKRNERKSDKKNDASKMQCLRCKRAGHMMDKCFAKTFADKSPIPGQPPAKPSTSIAVAKENPRTPSPEPNSEVETYNMAGVVVGAVTSADALMIPVSIASHQVNGMLDTGCSKSMMNLNLAEQLGLEIKIRKYNMVGADGQPLQCKGHATAKLAINLGKVTKAVDFRFVVTKDLCVPLLIGIDIIRLLRININHGGRVLRFENTKNGVRVIEPVKVPARQQLVVTALAEKVKTKTALIKPWHLTNSVMVSNGVSAVVDDCVEVLLVNISKADQWIDAGTQIASVEEITEGHNNVEAMAGATMEIGHSMDNVKIGPNLTIREKDELLELINDHLKAFSINGELGQTSMAEHDIELSPGTRPIVTPLRRRPDAHKLETSRQIKQMLDMGVIEPSNSPWASAYVVVKKKSGELRICIDFRALNAQTKKCSYPLPCVEDCLEPLIGNSYFTQLDLASGYWQVPMAERAKEYTAFRTEEGLFHFRRMPFGLCNAPASFQRAMNAIFGGMRGVHLQIFMDDICIATPSWQEHLEILGSVFKLLIKANLKLKPAKCVFGAQEVVFLGHLLNVDGIQPDPSKVRALEQLPAPKSTEEVRRFLGLVGYYRRMIPNFAMIAAPLTKLMCAKATFEWSHEQSLAFQDLLAKLAAYPVLAKFDSFNPVAVKTDASRQGVAGILLQRKEGEWRIISCCSRRLTPCEANYGVTDLEGLAIIYAIHVKFRNYLLGRQFTILTDHCALCSLKVKLPKSPRLQRWAVLLSEYDFTVTYTRGAQHRDVDCLSRAPVDDAIDEHLDDKVLLAIQKAAFHPVTGPLVAVVVPRNASLWKQELNRDDDAKVHLERAKARTKGYKTFDGLIYYEDRLFVPTPLRKGVLEEGHDDHPANHGGVRETLQRVKNYWWPQMSTDAADYVRSCEVCQRTKAERTKPAGESYSFNANRPVELVAFDCLGELQPSLANKRQVIVAIDSFTRFVDAVASDNIRGATCAMFMKDFMCRFGVPQMIRTDNAPSFVNQHVKALAEKYHFEHTLSTPNHHEGNAICERVIGSLQQKLRAIIHDPINASDWETLLPDTVLSLNTSTHSSTGYTPFELVFGNREAVPSPTVLKLTTPHSDYMHARKTDDERRLNDALEKQDQARTKFKQYFDSKHAPRGYEIGDLVLARVMGRRAKLQALFQGPYQVVRKSNDVYKIANITGRREYLERHTRDLRPFVIRHADKRQSYTEEISDDEDKDPGPSFQVSNNSAGQSTATSSITTALNTSSGGPMKTKTKVAVCYALAILVQASVHDHASPVLWLEQPIPVSPAPVKMMLKLSIGNPCPALLAFQDEYTDVHQAIAHCNGVYNAQVVHKIQRLALSAPRHNAPLVAPAGLGQQAPANYQHVNNQVALAGAVSQTPIGYPKINNQPIGLAKQQQQQPIAGYQRVGQPRPGARNSPHGRSNGPEEPHQNAMSRSKRSWQIIDSHRLPKVKPMQLWVAKDSLPKSNKRQLGMAFAAGAFVCDVWHTAKDHYWPSEANREMELHQQSVDGTLAAMVLAENKTEIELRALAEVMQLNNQLVEHNVERIDHFTSAFPVFGVVVSDVVARMHVIGSYIDKLRVSLKASHRIDLDSLDLLFDSPDILDGIAPDTVTKGSIRLEQWSANTIYVEFMAQRASKNTALYSVTAFKHWTDLLTSSPKLLEYDGPKYVVYNASENCVQGVEEPPHATYVAVSCLARNYHDERLAHWRVAYEGDPFEYKMEPQVKQSYPHVFVNCFPLKLTNKEGTQQCPPHVFNLPMDQPFTAGNYQYSPEVIGYTHNIQPGKTDVAPYHLEKDRHSIGVNQTEAIFKVQKHLQNESALKTIAFVPYVDKIGQGKLSYAVVAKLSIILLLVAAVATIYLRRRVVHLLDEMERARKESCRRKLAKQNPQAIYNMPDSPV